MWYPDFLNLTRGSKGFGFNHEKKEFNRPDITILASTMSSQELVRWLCQGWGWDNSMLGSWLVIIVSSQVACANNPSHSWFAHWCWTNTRAPRRSPQDASSNLPNFQDPWTPAPHVPHWFFWTWSLTNVNVSGHILWLANWDTPIALPNLDNSLTKEGGHKKATEYTTQWLIWITVSLGNYRKGTSGMRRRMWSHVIPACVPMHQVHTSWSKERIYTHDDPKWLSNTDWWVSVCSRRDSFNHPWKNHAISCHRERHSHQRPPNRGSRWSTAHVSPKNRCEMAGKENPTQPFQTLNRIFGV